MTISNPPNNNPTLASSDLRTLRRERAETVWLRKMYSILSSGVADHSDGGLAARDLFHVNCRALYGIIETLRLIEKRDRTGSLDAGETARLNNFGGRLMRFANVFEALSAVETEIDGLNLTQIQSYRPEDSAEWPE